MQSDANRDRRSRELVVRFIQQRCENGVVTPEQMIVILNELDTADTRLEWTLALLHAATALRPEESFGLKWSDIDWKRNLIHIRRGWSKGKETAGKNKVSMTEVALHPALAEALQAWRRETRYYRESDWVFASDRAKGKKPRGQLALPGKTIFAQRR